MTSLLDLPDELLVSILEHVRAQDFAGALNVLIVNKRIYRIAHEIIRRHVHLNPNRPAPLSQFVRDISYVRSLTLTRFTNHKDPLKILLRTLPSATRLTSLSLVPWMEKRSTRRHTASAIAQIIQVMPSTLTNFEMDSAEFGGPWRGVHMCSHIGRLIPRLRVLRVNLDGICAEFLHGLQGNATSQLRVAVTRFNEPQIPSANMGCGTLEASEFAVLVRQLLERGNFPSLEHFLIVDQSQPLAVLRGLNWSHHFRVRDVCTDKDSFHKYSDHGVFAPGERRYSIEGLGGETTTGSTDDLVKLTEGSASWITLSNGSRIPPSNGEKERPILIISGSGSATACTTP
ncbi:hypothetical protein K504DRAFT_487496 [Pleomassaria siparia CBS 279.74]|uniref:F-box domain-containing protein n=1 Tax=Pleomassaria siparia CBS 279.74 TaxID=1314801 RepID=A0A6G1KK03_9PLEO|nr:hypothetical protein K504DRAFT_487496 [Pleomassaria siparia CBS 279.74]